MLWRWRILTLVMAMVAAKLVWGWPPTPRWTAKVQDRERWLSWNHYERPVGFTADNAILFTEEDRSDEGRQLLLKRWSVATSECLEQIECQCRPAGTPRTGSVISPCGRFAAVFGAREPRPGTTREQYHTWLIDVSSGRTLADFPDRCNQCVFSDDGGWFAIPARGDQLEGNQATTDAVKLVRTAEPKVTRTFPFAGCRIERMCFSPDSRNLAVHVLDQKLFNERRIGPDSCILIELDTGRRHLRTENVAADGFFFANGWLIAVYLHHDESFHCYPVRWQCFDLWRTDAPRRSREILLPQTALYGWFFVDPVPGGVLVQEGREDHTANLVVGKGEFGDAHKRVFHHFDLETGQLCQRGEMLCCGGVSKISRDGSWAAVVDDHGYLRLWDIHQPRWKRWPWTVMAAVLVAGVLFLVGRWDTGRRQPHLAIETNSALRRLPIPSSSPPPP